MADMREEEKKDLVIQEGEKDNSFTLNLTALSNIKGENLCLIQVIL